MIVGDRLRAVREDRKLSQGDVERRTGLLRCYISRVENGRSLHWKLWGGSHERWRYLFTRSSMTVSSHPLNSLLHRLAGI